jgi:flagellar basal-body rod modification protein FlgD
MAISSLGGASPIVQSQVQQTALGQEDLFKILLTQLSYQDPLKPMDNQEFIAKLAQFASLEQSNQLNQKTDTLLAMQSANQSVGLIGRTVEVRTDTGTLVGQVTTVSFLQGSPTLTVLTSDNNILPDVTLDQISIVR